MAKVAKSDLAVSDKVENIRMNTLKGEREVVGARVNLEIRLSGEAEVRREPVERDGDALVERPCRLL